MSDLNFVIAPHGPLVLVDICPSTYFQRVNIPAGSSTPVVQRVEFLVDTGASHCLIDEDIIAPLQLFPTSGALVHSVSAGATGVKRPIFDLSLLMYSKNPGQGWLHGSVFVTAEPGSSFHGLPYRGLIGRDLLNRCSLFYDGPAQKFRISF